MHNTWWRLLAGLLIVVMALAACGGDDDGGNNGDEQDSTGAATPTAESGGEFNPGAVGPALSTGPDLGMGPDTEGGLPGCADPNDVECPMPLVMELTATAATDGVQIEYPERYFVAAVNESPADVLITITPSENNVYEQEATFEVYFAESVEAALGGAEPDDTAEWSTDTLSGTIAVTRDQAQDPPLNTTVGAFELPDGQVIVLKLTTTGTYGWDIWSRVYEDMLNTLTVSD